MNQACTIKTQPKLIKENRGHNSRDLTLALYNIDNNKKSLYCGYIDGNLDLMGVARPNSQTSPGCPLLQTPNLCSSLEP